MRETHPHFRFFPRAYEVDGVFRQDDTRCEVCGRTDTPIYDQKVYAADPPTVCAVCISDGSLGRRIKEGSYGLQNRLFCDIKTGKDVAFGRWVKRFFWSKPQFRYTEPVVDEIQRRTPGFATYQDQDWPVLNGRPMVFWGYGDEKAVFRHPGALEAMVRHERELGGDPRHLEKSGSPYLLVFKDLDRDQFEVLFDPD